MPLVINSLGHGHTNTYTDDLHRINFKKPGVLACGWHSPGLKIQVLHMDTILR